MTGSRFTHSSGRKIGKPEALHLPEGPRGRSSTKRIIFGVLYRPSSRLRIQKFLFRAALTIAHDDARHDLLPVVPIGNPHRCSVEHRRMPQQGFIDLAWRNVFTSLMISSLMRPVTKKKPSSSRYPRSPDTPPGWERMPCRRFRIFNNPAIMRPANHDLANSSIG